MSQSTSFWISALLNVGQVVVCIQAGGCSVVLCRSVFRPALLRPLEMPPGAGDPLLVTAVAVVAVTGCGNTSPATKASRVLGVSERDFHITAPLYVPAGRVTLDYAAR